MWLKRTDEVQATCPPGGERTLAVACSPPLVPRALWVENHEQPRWALGWLSSHGQCQVEVLGTTFCPRASFLVTVYCLNTLQS